MGGVIVQYLIIAVVLVFAAIAGAAVKICFNIPHKKFKNRTLNTHAKPYEAPLAATPSGYDCPQSEMPCVWV